jgi:hypothetical protein
VDLEIEVEAAPRRYRIVSVERKLPPHEAEATESAS